MGEQKDMWKETVDKVWPKTKKELEKAVENAKVMLNKGETYLKTVSEKGLEKTKQLSLNLKKEKLHYELGKVVATTVSSTWTENKRIAALLKEIKSIDKQIAKLKK